MYKCTAEDLDRFYEPSTKSAGLVKMFKDKEAFMCLNWNDLKLRGEDPAENTRTIDVMLMPCNMKETLLASKEDGIPEDCNYDREKLIEYMDAPRMLVWSNNGRF